MAESVIVSVEIPVALDRKILEEAARFGHRNRSAVIRMALNNFFTNHFAKIRKAGEEKCIKEKENVNAEK